MAARTLPVILALTLCSAACSHKLAPLGRFQTTPVVADGLPDDWTLPLRFANSAYTLQYNITNDDRNIYICALSNDERTIIRMLRAGMTVYFDPKGETARDISLHYPLRKQPDPNIRNRNGEPLTSQPDSGWKEELLQQSDSYGTTGFSGIENGQFSVAGNKGPIQVAIRLTHHDSLLVYEAIVPIGNILGSELAGRNPETKFSVGVILNTPSGQTVMTGSHRPGGHGLSMGTNGIHMGGGGGSHRNYNTNSNDAPPIKEDANWYQFRLAAGSPQRS
ncbi:MAG TPA: hypothetical protein VMH27_08005 [Puia sp.]|nr:hypothetical protein [Puia sp.]